MQKSNERLFFQMPKYGNVCYKKECTLHFYKKQFFQAGEYAPRLDSVILIIKIVYMFDFLYMCVSLNVYNN